MSAFYLRFSCKTKEDSVASYGSQVSPKLTHIDFLISTTEHDKGYKYFRCNYKLHLHTPACECLGTISHYSGSMSPWCPLSLRKPLILNPLWQQRQLWEFHVRNEGRVQEGADRRAVLRSWTRLTLPHSRGFHLPRSRTPWLWVISTTTDIQTRHVPREAPKCSFLNFYFLILKKKTSHILRKSLMRFAVWELFKTHSLSL